MVNQVKGQLFIYPTNTVWGIGAMANDCEANLKIKLIKKSSPDKPLSLLFNDFKFLATLLNISSSSILANFKKILNFKTTLLLSKNKINKSFSKVIVGESDYVGIRIMKYEDSLNKALAEKNISHINNPIITTTSLNLKGEDPIVDYESAIQFNIDHCFNSAIFIDLNLKISKLPSTIIQFEHNQFQVIRGGADLEKIQPFL